MTKSLMFVGTGSESGKSIITAGFCRILKRMGISVAPFKAQNMALNSYIAKDGGEMGRAQVVQAEAAGIEPSVDMNPILLKPTSEKGSQIIVHGRVHADMDASQYYMIKKKLWDKVIQSYERLKKSYAYIVIEGAGSPVEMNLKQSDIVNMKVAEYADASVVLVADIDRGGVFASIVGTMDLLEEKEKKRLMGFIINKFRGDKALLDDGLKFIEQKTGRPVLGVVPYLHNLYIPGEDSVSIPGKIYARPGLEGKQSRVSVAVIILPHLSNYTDFDPLEFDTRFRVDYLNTPTRLRDYDAVILPGTKNVFYDLKYLREQKFTDELYCYYTGGGRIAGICGGYQMLGHYLYDPCGVESTVKKIDGLGLLPVYSIFGNSKKTAVTRNRLHLPGTGQCVEVEGYEIHMGQSYILDGHNVPCLNEGGKKNCSQQADTVASKDGRIWGTYLHGLFENDAMRSTFLQWICGEKTAVEGSNFSYKEFKEHNYESLADAIEQNVNVQYILSKAGIKC